MRSRRGKMRGGGGEEGGVRPIVSAASSAWLGLRSAGEDPARFGSARLGPPFGLLSVLGPQSVGPCIQAVTGSPAVARRSVGTCRSVQFGRLGSVGEVRVSKFFNHW